MAASLDIFCFLLGGNGDDGLEVYVLEQGLDGSRYSWKDCWSGLRRDAIETMARLLGGLAARDACRFPEEENRRRNGLVQPKELL